jgi:hypothetical protein
MESKKQQITIFMQFGTEKTRNRIYRQGSFKTIWKPYKEKKTTEWALHLKINQMYGSRSME